jgi:hypothetical protein
MAILSNLLIVGFLIGWVIFGGYLIARSGALFGLCEDHRSESPGARSYGVAHIVAMWIGGFALGIYFLCQ